MRCFLNYISLRIVVLIVMQALACNRIRSVVAQQRQQQLQRAAVQQVCSTAPSSSSTAASMAPDTSAQPHPRNVLGGPLECCCTSTMTGFYRDGYCRTDMMDQGRHVVCAQVTDDFLQFSRARGNNLMSPVPMANFPGLKDGDKWCLCAGRWFEAHEAGCAPPLYLKATHIKALEYVSLDVLKQYALDADAAE